MRALAAAPALLAAAAQAQPAFSPVPKLECLADGGGTDCAGLSANACQMPADGRMRW